MTKKPKLLPCPFCGSKKGRVWNSDNLFVMCFKCYAKGPTSYEVQTEDEAIALWNRRKR